MREVVWDKGPVRCGTVTKSDGAHAPRFHDSEVAAIGYALQQMLIKRGFLDSQGAQVPVQQLAARLVRRDADDMHVEAMPSDLQLPQGGKKCPECGALALHKVDGCLRCANCNHLGSCG
jgi:ribonucleoside-diphosphate reductase alpha chain